MRWKIAPAICGLLLLACGPASAQVFMGQTVASCGTAPSTRSAGIPYPVLMDTNGNFCTNASGSGGGGAVFGPTATGSAAANPPVLIGGTTTGGATGTVQGAAVKPASTAPLATDPALVVAISPNSSDTVKSGTYVSAGTPQFGLTVASATSLTVPSGSTIAEICAETAGVRYRDDGSAPTSSTGIPVAAGQCFQYAGPLSAVQFIAQSGSPTLDVSYYK